MRTVAIIPARGGSKGVPGKNLRQVGGVSLVERAVTACAGARNIDAVYVSTDDPFISAAAQRAGAAVIERPADLAGDLASSESALLHGLDHLATAGHHPEILVFVQCTSPFIQSGDLEAAVGKIMDDTADSVLSGVETFEFLWRDTDPSLQPGTAEVGGQNHDPRTRPRRQDRRPDFRETGAFYAMRSDGFRKHRHRFFGRTAIVPVHQFGSLEIDTAEELSLADAVAALIDRPQTALAAPVPQTIEVDAIITDFDGVHTDDTAYVDADGTESVRVSRSDGMGVGLIRQQGVPFLILSKERNPVVTTRAAKLGVDVLQGIDDKATALSQWLRHRGINPSRAAYLGNDVNDLGPMSVVGWPIAVADAHPRVLQAAKVILTRDGGRGAVRELCDRVLEAQPQRQDSLQQQDSVVPLMLADVP